MTISLNSFSADDIENVISHRKTNLAFDITKFETILKSKTNNILPIEQEIALLHELAEFELGRFLLLNKGLDGFWTSYLILHGPKKSDLYPLENWLLNKAPSVRATQERFKIFQNTIIKYAKAYYKIASIPCGLMDDLLTLTELKNDNIELIGIDLDNESIELAKENAQKHGFSNVKFYHKNAWALNVKNQYNIITSNGLNIYEPDDLKVVSLYKEFYDALAPEGILITSFLTPPPALSAESTWQNVIPEDAKKQKAIFTDVIGVNWQSFRTESQTRMQLEKAGFKVIEVIYDSQGIFPTIIAQK